MKQYIKPSIELLYAEISEMLAVSIVDGDADPSKVVLTKENNDWDIWEE